MDVVTALAERQTAAPLVVGAATGCRRRSSPRPWPWRSSPTWRRPARNHFTIGIVDDVTRTSLHWDPAACREREEVVRAVSSGWAATAPLAPTRLGQDRRRAHRPVCPGVLRLRLRKSGSRTVSHLRFSPQPIESTYLIGEAGFVACHQFGLLDQVGSGRNGGAGSDLAAQQPVWARRVWGQIPGEVQQQILDKELDLWVVDAHSVAREAGLGGRVNTVLQTCFFALQRSAPGRGGDLRHQGRGAEGIRKEGRGRRRRNELAIDRALAALHRVEVPVAPSRAPTGPGGDCPTRLPTSSAG